MTARRIDLLPLPKRQGRTPMLYQGKAIGASNSPIYAGARWLLDNGLAWPDDVVSTYRGETLCMSGKAGELAKWTVEEAKHGNPSLILRRWKAFEPLGEGSLAPETPERVLCDQSSPGRLLCKGRSSWQRLAGGPCARARYGDGWLPIS
jgi:hypothetical protein